VSPTRYYPTFKSESFILCWWSRLSLVSVTLGKKTERIQDRLCMQIRHRNMTLFNLGYDAGESVEGQTMVVLKSQNSKCE